MVLTLGENFDQGIVAFILFPNFVIGHPYKGRTAMLPTIASVAHSTHIGFLALA
jgi:hypothetical protein